MEEEFNMRKEDKTNLVLVTKGVAIPGLFSVPDSEGNAPISNYTEYDLFSVETRITPYLESRFGKGSFPLFEFGIKEDRLDLLLRPIRGVDKIDLTEEDIDWLEVIVDKITTEGFDYLLLLPFVDLTSDLYGRIPSSYVHKMSKYISIPDYYNPHIGNNGLLISITEDRFQDKFVELSLYVVKQIRQMYENGLMVMSDPEIIKDWNLVAVNEDDYLYMPSWKDGRITNHYLGPVNFINSRLRGDKTLNIEIENNLGIKHKISEILDCEFIGSFLRFNVDNLKDAREKLTKINIVCTNIYGTFIAVNAFNLEHAKYHFITMDPSMKTIYNSCNDIIVSYQMDYNVDEEEEKKDILKSFNINE